MIRHKRGPTANVTVAAIVLERMLAPHDGAGGAAPTCIDGSVA